MADQSHDRQPETVCCCRTTTYTTYVVSPVCGGMSLNFTVSTLTFLLIVAGEQAGQWSEEKVHFNCWRIWPYFILRRCYWRICFWPLDADLLLYLPNLLRISNSIPPWQWSKSTRSFSTLLVGHYLLCKLKIRWTGCEYVLPSDTSRSIIRPVITFEESVISLMSNGEELCEKNPGPVDLVRMLNALLLIQLMPCSSSNCYLGSICSMYKEIRWELHQQRGWCMPLNWPNTILVWEWRVTRVSTFIMFWLLNLSF